MSATNQNFNLPKAKKRKKSLIPIIFGISLLFFSGWLAYNSLGESLEFFKTPSEYKMQETILKDKILRLGGIIKNSNYNPQTLELKFTITDGSVSYPVQYKGAVSDLFKENQGVIVRGKFQNGIFMANELVVKHSEEYQAPKDQEDIDQLKIKLGK